MKMYLESPIEDGDFPWPCSCFFIFIFFWGGNIYDPILMRMFDGLPCFFVAPKGVF